MKIKKNGIKRLKIWVETIYLKNWIQKICKRSPHLLHHINVIKINHGLLLQSKKLISKLLNQNHIKFFGDHEFEKYECHDQSVKLFFHDQTYRNYDGIVFCMGASSLSLFKGLKTTQGKMAGINSSEFIDPMMPINHDCCITPQVGSINWIASLLLKKRR